MPISTMDPGDANSPQGLVELVLKVEPILTIPVPIQELCARLGIIGKKAVDTNGFECGLVITAKRFEGIILAECEGGPRCPLPIAHELVRGLMAHHVPERPGWSTSKRSHFLHATAKSGDPQQRSEVEANRFAALIVAVSAQIV